MTNWFKEAIAIRFAWKADTIDFHIGILWILLFVVWLLAGCSVTAGNRADRNQEYARNCGYAMDELLLCRDDRP